MDLENPIYNINWVVFQEMGILFGGLSDCEELVGLLMEKLVFKNFKKVFLF